MSTIEEIYYTTVYPKYDSLFNNGEYREFVKRSIAAENQLRTECPEAAELIDRCEAYRNEISEIVSRTLFTVGFRMGAQLMLEILSRDE